MIIEFEGKKPSIHKSCYIAETAVIIGDVSIDEDSNIWFGAILRGDIAPIKIGKRTNVQENTVIHVEKDSPVIIGDDVTIGHSAVIHGATIENNVLVGMKAVVLNKTIIKEFSVVGASALVSEGKTYDPESLILGVPAKFVRELTTGEKEGILKSSKNYVLLSKAYKKEK